jgi:archaemetzincin
MKKHLPSAAIGLAVVAAVAFVAWAYTHRGESYAEDELIPAEAGKICIVPIGEVDESDLVFARDFVEASFGRETVTCEPLPLQDEYYYPGRGQYGANSLLRYLEANSPPGAYRAVGITEQDIFTGELNFLFGIARCPGKCAVVSTHRFDNYCDSPEQRMVRFAKLLQHETGHTFGLLHCRQRLCIMKFADGYKTMDDGRLSLCARCEKSLCAAAGVDAEERREKMEAVLKEYGLWEEAGGAEGLATPPAPANLAPEPAMP